ncbi:MAG TPA: hypothetical protein VI232_04030 [Reyranella sp.]
MPAIEQERTLWVRRENERRKGRKGRKPPAAIQRVGFVNDINHLDVHGGGRFAPLGVAETGGNRRKLHTRIGVSLAEIAETPEIEASFTKVAEKDLRRDAERAAD